MGSATPILLKNDRQLSVETKAHLVDLQRAVLEECRRFEAPQPSLLAPTEAVAISARRPVFASFLVEPV